MITENKRKIQPTVVETSPSCLGGNAVYNLLSHNKKPAAWNLWPLIITQEAFRDRNTFLPKSPASSTLNLYLFDVIISPQSQYALT